MKIATSHSERIALIREIAERKKKMKMIKAEAQTVFRKAPKVSHKMMDVADEDTSKNPNYWTDASKYANQYYGETFRATTQYDNDWGDY